MDLGRILEEMTFISWAVVGVLIIMSVATVAITVERTMAYRKAKLQSLDFARFSGPLLKDRHLGKIIAAKDEPLYKYSYVARLVTAGLEEADDLVGLNGNLDNLETVSAACRRAAETEILFLRRGTSVVATVGASAPFVGLLGTVIGIIGTFQDMESAGSGGFETVVGSLGEALIVTALGLVVAIPATWVYNYFNSRMEGFQVLIDNTISEFIDYLRKHGDKLNADSFTRPKTPTPTDTVREG